MGIKVVGHFLGKGKKSYPSVDIVAVHGLDENGTNTWTDPETGCFWLQDLIPTENLDARTLTFDYKSDASSFFGSGSADRILYHAQTLVEELYAEREIDGRIERPIIFICHGLGGILVKKALALSSSSTSSKLAHLYSIFTSTFGIIFMGTPHEGIENARWPSSFKGLRGIVKERSNLFMSIQKNSETLQNVSDQFAPLLDQFRIYNFWEMVETSFGGVKDFIVSPASAAPVWEDTERSGIMATHAGMCRFQSKDISAYRNIVAALTRYTREASHVIGFRWKEAKKYLDMRRRGEAAEILAFNIHKENQLYYPEMRSPKAIENQHFLVPYTVSSIFTGRDTLARGIKEKILSPNGSSKPPKQKRFVVYGLGGSGKTQFCLKFVHDNRDKFWGVFWVDASSTETAEQAFSALGRLGNMEEKFEAGLYWLARQDMPWLLVIDNADDAGFDYSKYFPSGDRGHILVTSRNPDCRMHATIGFEEFKELEHEDAVTLLLRAAAVEDTLDKESRSSAGPIVKALGHLPLALIQAGASIRQNICTLDEYLEVFDSYKNSIFENNLWQGKESYKYTVYTTFEVSFRKIKSFNTEESIDALEILHILAFLHFDQVPALIFENAWDSFQADGTLSSSFSFFEKVWRVLKNIATMTSNYEKLLSMLGNERLPRILMQTGSKWDKIRFRKALHVLSSYSLIFKNISKDCYSMHPMVQFWARQRLQLSAQMFWANVTSHILAASITSGAEEENAIYRRYLLPHIDTCLKADSNESRQGLKFDDKTFNRFTKFATVYAEGGRWHDAIKIQEQILDHNKRLLGPDSFETLDTSESLAQSYWNSSQIRKTLELQGSLLEVFTERLGPHDPRTLKATNNLGRACWLSGQLVRAEQLGKKAVEGSTRLLGADHPYTINALHDYARASAHLGHHKEAQRIQLEVLKVRSNRHGLDDAGTLETMQDLAMSCLALGDKSKAESLVSHVLETRKRVLGQEHAYTLWSVNDLSKVYCAQGYPKDAIALCTPTLEISTRTLGAYHIGTFMTISNLTQANILLQRWDEAEALLIRLVEDETRVLGPTHRDVQVAKLQYASVCKSKGDRSKAESLTLEVIQAREETLGPDHPHTLKAKELLHSLNGASDKSEKAASPKVS